MLDYMISYSWQSCCGERAGSYINQIKTAARAVLDPDTLDFLAYNAFNMPSLHEMDFNCVIKQWSEDGKLSGVDLYNPPGFNEGPFISCSFSLFLYALSFAGFRYSLFKAY